MNKITFEEVKEHYETALAEKENNTKDVITGIIDNNLTDEFASIQKEKEKINSLEDLYTEIVAKTNK